ncbi:MAG: polyprenol monophosphomannose synthase [Micrococcales bacterium]|nr:polyprenol monophosphomannose synthase [Micrococcales bacterium]
MRTLVIIPTYNERESLPLVLHRLRSAVPDADVLIADDNSPDGTGKWADEQALNDPSIHVMHRGGKAGLGAAYLAGFAWGLERGYEVLCEMDADGSHPPERLPALLAAVADGADLAIGSRWVPGGEVVNWPKRREVLSRGGNFYIRVMLRLGVSDATAGFRAYRASLLERMDLGGVEARGYAFQVDMTRRSLAYGAVIKEIPISFVEREVGESKMSSAIVREALLLVTRWGLRDRFRRGGKG